METLQDAYDALRDVQDARRQYGKEAGLFGEDRTEDLAKCDALEAGIRGRIVEILDSSDFEDSMSVQTELVARYAKRFRLERNAAAEWFVKEYSGTFRALWNQGVTEIPELEYLMYRKGG